MEKERDMINPAHYKEGGIEAIDYMKAKSTPVEYRGFLRLNALKYLSRAGKKGDELEDIEKAGWYISKLVEELREDAAKQPETHPGGSKYVANYQAISVCSVVNGPRKNSQ